MAVSIDLQVFAKNSSSTTQAFLRRASMYIWLAGFSIWRFIVFFNYLMASMANKDNNALVKLTIYKSLSRLFNVVLSIVSIVLLSQNVNREWVIYIIVPIFLISEYGVNVLSINAENLKNSPQVSYKSLRERYSKINNVLISAFIISGSIQFAFYFKSDLDMYMLIRVSFVYLIAFLMWWTYSNRVYRFDIKRQASSHVILGSINILIAASLSLLGGMLINAYNDVNLDIIIPSVFFALMAFIVLITATIYTFTSPKGETFNRPIKKYFIAQATLAVVILLVMGILSLSFSFSVYVMYGVVTGALIWLALSSRYIIETKIKKKA